MSFLAQKHWVFVTFEWEDEKLHEKTSQEFFSSSYHVVSLDKNDKNKHAEAPGTLMFIFVTFPSCKVCISDI